MLREDPSEFLSDFAETADVGGNPVSGIFDARFATAFDIAGTDPVFLCSQQDAEAILRSGMTLRIRGTEYSVTGIEPDGVMATLRLQEV
jgi:hypothetical protein